MTEKMKDEELPSICSPRLLKGHFFSSTEKVRPDEDPPAVSSPRLLKGNFFSNLTEKNRDDDDSPSVSSPRLLKGLFFSNMTTDKPRTDEDQPSIGSPRMLKGLFFSSFTDKPKDDEDSPSVGSPRLLKGQFFSNTTEKSKDDDELPTVSSPRMRLAMLMQVKGYMDNLKGSLDSLKDEVLHKSKRDAADAEYPAYGVTGPCKDFSPAAADRKLAQSAHMFHYQHQKQQMIALEKSSGDERHCSTSDVDSEEEGEEGDYTVYECPGLAPTDEMEVKNPLFSDDPTPATPARKKKGENGNKEEGDEDDDEEED